MKNKNKIRITLIFISTVSILVYSPLMNTTFSRGIRDDSSSINNFNLGLDLSMQTEIFGYRLDVSRDNPIKRDENAVIEILHLEDNIAEVIIKTGFGEFEFDDLFIEEETIDDGNTRLMVRYEVENPRKGFFMEIHIMSDLTRINVAFDDGDCQLSYDGIIRKGIMDYNTKNGNSVKSTELDLIDLETNEQEYIERIKTQQIENIQVNKRKTPTLQGDMREGEAPFYKYGVVHESYDFGVDYPEDLWDDYWDPYTSLDYGIYRYLPTEAQVKNDLQFYNTVYMNPYYTSRRIIPYTMGTHGGPEWEIWIIVYIMGEPYQVEAGLIYPSEISDLWYNVGGTYCYSAESLVMVDVSYGYWFTVNEPEMAEAFVDDGGADAFVGATISPPGDSDDYMNVFWDELSRLNEDVYDATDALCDEYGSPWNVGDEWRIYGDDSKTLPG